VIFHVKCRDCAADLVLTRGHDLGDWLDRHLRSCPDHTIHLRRADQTAPDDVQQLLQQQRLMLDDLAERLEMLIRQEVAREAVRVADETAVWAALERVARIMLTNENDIQSVLHGDGKRRP